MPLIRPPNASLLVHLGVLLRCANENAALLIEALCNRSAVLADDVHLACPDAGQVEVAEEICRLLGSSQLAQLAPAQVPRFVIDRSAPYALGAKLARDSSARFDAFQPTPSDRYSVHCTPQIHGASLELLRHAQQVIDSDCVTEAESESAHEAGVRRYRPSTRAVQRGGGAFDLARTKAAIAAMSSISERRLAKLLDPNQNHGLPGSLVPNPDGHHYGLTVLRFRAAVLVNELSELATPARPNATAAIGASDPEATIACPDTVGAEHMCEALQSVLTLERYAAVQALRVRMAMLARIHGHAAAPTPGDFALDVLGQFDRAGLQPIWDAQRRPHEIDTARRLMLESPV